MKLIGLLMILTTLTCLCSSSCSSFTSTTTIIVDSADVQGLRIDKAHGMEIKDISK